VKARPVALLLAAAASASAADLRPIALDDLHRLEVLAEPDLSPDGRWVAYTVTRDNTETDETNSDLWLASMDGRERRRLTHTDKTSESAPRWSPDGQWLAFLSAREDADEQDQVWLLPRAGGEAHRLTDLRGGVSDFAWAPDGKRLVLVSRDPADDAATPKAERKPRPQVIDRYQFKEDELGFLDRKRHHLYAFTIETKAAVLLTPGDHDEQLPAWSPDGRHIVYVTKRGDDPDRHINYDLYLVDPDRPGSERRLTTFDGADADPLWETRPAWSPDSRRIAFPQGGEERWLYYATWKLAVVDVASGESRLATDLDRPFTQPRWSADGRAIYALVEESRNTWLSRIDPERRTVTRVSTGPRYDSDFDLDGKAIVLLSSDDLHPARLTALDLRGRGERPLAPHNEWLDGVRLQPSRDITFASPDGTKIDGFLTLPANHRDGQRHPTILRIHGGPVYQFSHEFMFDWQLFAANGYAVVGANPRGSSGRGFDFARAIHADWGNLDTQDVLAAVDHAVAAGVADPDRLGVGGWSYGGILTDFVIAKDTRFKAAISGAGAASALGTWGDDMYIREYTAELGTPWGNTDKYLHVSYPLLHADRIRTPTLFMCGDADFNVPLIGSEQLYQALRILNVPTQLVIYPDEYHGITRPSFVRDRLSRYLAWYDRFLKAH
jgi:dipeptidyl aminopeptidase/acylaminoacyl peptidase